MFRRVSKWEDSSSWCKRPLLQYTRITGCHECKQLHQFWANLRCSKFLLLCACVTTRNRKNTTMEFAKIILYIKGKLHISNCFFIGPWNKCSYTSSWMKVTQNLFCAFISKTIFDNPNWDSAAIELVALSWRLCQESQVKLFLLPEMKTGEERQVTYLEGVAARTNRHLRRLPGKLGLGLLGCSEK